jgi:iron complex transport system substrate-binding protein
MRPLLAILAFFAAARAEPRGGIVSLDHCADLHVLAFAKRGEILALSPGAGDDYAFLRGEAEGLPSVPAEAEAILALKPSLVLRSYGGDARLLFFLERGGAEILEIGFPQTLEEIETNTRRIAKRLGGTAPSPPKRPGAEPEGSALYLAPSGIVAGRATLPSLLLEEAGLTNHETRAGWHELPLEGLITERPSRLVTGFFGSKNRFEGWWGAMRHPLAQNLIESVPRTDIPGDRLACPAFPALAVPALIAAGP